MEIGSVGAIFLWLVSKFVTMAIYAVKKIWCNHKWWYFQGMLKISTSKIPVQSVIGFYPLFQVRQNKGIRWPCYYPSGNLVLFSLEVFLEEYIRTIRIQVWEFHPVLLATVYKRSGEGSRKIAGQKNNLNVA